jgi:predicted metalloprotease with PDZ domain
MKRVVVLLISVCAAVAAQEPVRYTVRFSAPHTHYLEVEATVPAGKPQVELFMAVWTPGSYLVREYARNVEDFRAASATGAELSWRKTRKNRWQVDAAGAGTITVRYKVYARELNVQGNFVDASFAMMNGAPNFMTLVGGEKRPYEVRLELPAGWSRSISGMREGSVPHSYAAADFDELLDCPLYAGNGPIHEFSAAGKPHYLVNQGEPPAPLWDGPASAQALRKIVEEYARMFNGLPYEKYVFFNMIGESGGGLEHKNSTWMGTSRWSWSNAQEPSGEGGPSGGGRRPSRLGWLGLASHEYFHTWNVKRLRPVELGPFDYESEVYTRSLWIAEGFTSYYGPLALGRAKLASQNATLNSLSGTISQVQTTPGRLVQPVETASYDAWIKLYRRDENSANTTLSYYPKGAVIGFLLDAKIRAATGGARSLDDLMRVALERYGKERGYTPEEFRRTASEVAGKDLSGWFKQVLESTEELDYTEALEWFGLRFKAPARAGGARVHTGVTVNSASGRILVTQVRRDSPAWHAGLNYDDEIIAVNGFRLLGDAWPSRLEPFKAGQTVEVLVSRRGELKTLRMPIVEEKPQSWTLEVRPDATAAQKANLKAWLMQ